MAKKYAIVPLVDVITEMLDACIETSMSTLRKNVVGDEVILKFSGDTPPILSGYTIYTHAEIKAIIFNEANGWRESEA